MTCYSIQLVREERADLYINAMGIMHALQFKVQAAAAASSSSSSSITNAFRLQGLRTKRM